MNTMQKTQNNARRFKVSVTRQIQDNFLSIHYVIITVTFTVLVTTNLSLTVGYKLMSAKT